MSDTASILAAQAPQTVPDNLDGSKLSSDRIVRRGQAALTRLRGSRAWNDWLEIGEALQIGRSEALYVSKVNKPKGRAYNVHFGAWLKKHGFDTINEGDRKRLFDVMEHREAIGAWRDELSPGDLLALNPPSAVWRK
jgi:hypothetical protein